MRDELDARIWNDHHEAVTEGMDRALAAFGRVVARFGQWDGTTHQLFALIAAFLTTGLTFNTTA